MKRHNTTIRNVERASTDVHTLLFIRELIPERRCQEWGNSFTQVSTLRRHHKIHTGKRPNRCQECGKSFTRHANLQAHHRIHTGEKPYRCQECCKSFTTCSSLRRHQKIHVMGTLLKIS
ncbi:Putative zinc finger protein 826 [Lemmus lemmus]